MEALRTAGGVTSFIITGGVSCGVARVGEVATVGSGLLLQKEKKKIFEYPTHFVNSQKINLGS